jgi:hypothetical protein
VGSSSAPPTLLFFEETYLPYWFFDHAVLSKFSFRSARIAHASFRKAQFDDSRSARGSNRGWNSLERSLGGGASTSDIGRHEENPQRAGLDHVNSLRPYLKLLEARQAKLVAA